MVLRNKLSGDLGGGGKLVHEQLALQLTLSRDAARESALQCSWFFFELMIKVTQGKVNNFLKRSKKLAWQTSKFLQRCGSGSIISSESGFNLDQGFDDQKLKKKNIDLIKTCNLLMPSKRTSST